MNASPLAMLARRQRHDQASALAPAVASCRCTISLYHAAEDEAARSVVGGRVGLCRGCDRGGTEPFGARSFVRSVSLFAEARDRVARLDRSRKWSHKGRFYQLRATLRSALSRRRSSLRPYVVSLLVTIDGLY